MRILHLCRRNFAGIPMRLVHEERERGRQSAYYIAVADAKIQKKILLYSFPCAKSSTNEALTPPGAACQRSRL